MSTEADDVVGQALYTWDDTGFQHTSFATDHYILAIGMPVDVGTKDEPFPRLMYCVINRIYGVVEHCDSCLPRCIATMNEMERTLAQMSVKIVSNEEQGKPRGMLQ